MRICFHILYSGLLDPKGCYKRGRATWGPKSSPPQPCVVLSLRASVSTCQRRKAGTGEKTAEERGDGRAVGSWHTWLPSPSVQLGRCVGLPGAPYTEVPRTGSNGCIYFFYSPEDGRPRCWQCWFPSRSLSLAHRRLSSPRVLTCSSLRACVCPSLFLGGEDTSQIGFEPVLRGPFDLITSRRSCLQIYSHSEVLGVRT